MIDQEVWNKLADIRCKLSWPEIEIIYEILFEKQTKHFEELHNIKQEISRIEKIIEKEIANREIVLDIFQNLLLGKQNERN